MKARICVDEMNVVDRLDPSHRTTELGVKPAPLIVNVNDGLFRGRDEGIRLDMLGVGLLIVNVRELEVPPPGVGVNTVIGLVPPFEISAAVTTAVS
jgi:hypothetical protein